MADRDQYLITGDTVEDLKRSVNFALTRIENRLEEPKEETAILLPVGHTRPSVASGRLFTTKNPDPVTITHFTGGYGGQEIDVFFGDSNTIIDFESGNLRSNGGVSWPVTQNQYLHAVYDEATELWYCNAWDLSVAVTSSEVSAASSRWEFVEFSGDRTLQASDAFRFLKSMDPTAQTVTVPTFASAGFQVGDQVSFLQYGAGQLTIAAAVGVTINTPSNLTVNEQFGTVVIVADDTDQWFIAGRMTP